MRLPRVPVGGEGMERWLITYADMITLLLVMFIVLFAFANTDLEKFKALADSLAEGFGATSAGAGQRVTGEASGTELGNSPIFDTSGGGTSPITLFPEHQSPIQIFLFEAPPPIGETEQQRGLLAELEALVGEAMAEATLESLREGRADLQGITAKVSVSYNERGIMISIEPNEILFDSGSAVIKPKFREILDLLASRLSQLPNLIEVRGHTDSVPINTMTYPSNWELSAGRAGSVIRYFERLGIAPGRLSAAGYADTRPLASNETREGRAKNRRVEIIILRSTSGPEQWISFNELVEKMESRPVEPAPAETSAAPGPPDETEAAQPTSNEMTHEPADTEHEPDEAAEEQPPLIGSETEPSPAGE